MQSLQRSMFEKNTPNTSKCWMYLIFGPPVQLWSDRIIVRSVRPMIVYKNQYEKIYIPKDLNKRILLAEKKLLEIKDQLLKDI